MFNTNKQKLIKKERSRCREQKKITITQRLFILITYSNMISVFIYSRRRFFEVIDEPRSPLLSELADFGYECNTELGYERPVKTIRKSCKFLVTN
jgi:hypothetical protein